jgi:hypothetical protein
MGDPAATTPSFKQLTLVLDLLKVLTPTQAIRDPALGRALDPFRGHPPIALLCGNATCHEPFLWCAIDPLTARVRFGRRGPALEAPETRRQPPPFDRWVPEDDAGEPLAPPGEPLLRWRFLCPRCARPCVLTNRRMLSLIARALASGRSEIKPAVE